MELPQTVLAKIPDKALVRKLQGATPDTAIEGTVALDFDIVRSPKSVIPRAEQAPYIEALEAQNATIQQQLSAVTGLRVHSVSYGKACISGTAQQMVSAINLDVVKTASNNEISVGIARQGGRGA